MKLVNMRFKDYQWKHNPREISFECEKKLNELRAPYGSSYIQETGRKNMIIKGSGELTGSDCLEQFAELFELFRLGGAGVLSVPKLTPMYAVFEKIKLESDPKPDILTYSFVFREVMTEKPKTVPSSYVVDYGENLWDVSYKFNIPIEKLLTLNPEIQRPDEVRTSYEVKLC